MSASSGPDISELGGDPFPARARGLVGPYELLLELAAGGMAVVYLARARDGRAVAPLVAIKRPHRHLASDKNYLAMLLDEARLASAIDHENVVRVHELRFDEGEPSIIMDYVDGAALSDLWRELAAAGRAFDPKLALRIALDALAGMHAAHELKDVNGNSVGLVHRDISPHNVLVGSDGRSRLADFGIAQAADRFQATKTDEVKGKLAYLAPERVDRRRICTRQSDVFALGVVLWECLAGRRLFRGDEALDTLQEVLHLSIPRLRAIGCELPAPIDDAIARALSRDLEVRFATALDFSNALVRAAGPGGVAPREHVARLVEAIAGPRMAERQERIRRRIEDDAATEQLLQEAGLSHRDLPGPDAPPSETSLDSLAPPAPSDHYVLERNTGSYGGGAGARSRFGVSSLVGRRAWLIAAVLGGVALGAGGTVAFANHGASVGAVTPTSPPPAPSTPPPQEAMAPGSPPELAAPGPAPEPSSKTSDWVSATTRRVTIRIPLIATRVVVDGVGHDIAPAADVTRVDVPIQSGAGHHVIVTALDGTISEADVTERDGFAQVAPARPPPASSAHGAMKKPGVTKNGFTKLR